MVNIYPYVKSTQLFTCPSAKSPQDLKFDSPALTFPWIRSYGISELVVGMPNPIKVAQVGKTSEMALLGDCTFTIWNSPTRVYNAGYDGPPTGPPVLPVESQARHLGGSNVAYMDGHVKYLPQSKMGPLNPNDLNTWNFALIYDPTDPRLQ